LKCFVAKMSSGTVFMHELLSTSEMTEADRLAAGAGIAGLVLMERAGRAVAEAAQSLLLSGGKVGICCGGGNNGGDGMVAARVLAGRGYDVSVFLLGDRLALRGDAKAMAERWDGPLHPVKAFDPSSFDLIIDALIGAGLSRDLDSDAAECVRLINQCGKPVVAVDVPSGIDGNTGKIRGVAVSADITVSFFRLKPGHILYPGRKACGKILLADIGIPDSVLEVIKPKLALNSPELWRHLIREPEEEGHKFNRGHVVVLSGGPESTGAARLAAHAAARAGAGLVTVASPSEALIVNAAALTDIMVRSSDGVEGLRRLLDDPRRNTIILGPGNGVGQPLRDCVELGLLSGRSMVIDADALTSFEGKAEALAAKIGPEHAKTVVATPHDGEFSRLFHEQPEISGIADRLGRAQAAARFLGIVIVLKGPDCVIASPDGRARINRNGTPWLATAGSGDVLAGLVGGLLAQGIDAFDAASAAVWLHAEAGRRVGPGLLAHDLPVALRGVLAALLDGEAFGSPIG
jgi:ADP-dependent NAD(P)H-hydrate dehydratase / NAD(P)H-hydrate epimerase